MNVPDDFDMWAVIDSRRLNNLLAVQRDRDGAIRQAIAARAEGVVRLRIVYDRSTAELVPGGVPVTNDELIAELQKLDPEAEALMHFVWHDGKSRRNFHGPVRQVLAGGVISNMLQINADEKVRR